MEQDSDPAPGLLEGCRQVPGGTGDGGGGWQLTRPRNKGDGANCGLLPLCQALAKHFLGLVLKCLELKKHLDDNSYLMQRAGNRSGRGQGL